MINNTQFGTYTLEDKLGTGGMAVVYRAYDKLRDTRVAIKILHSSWAAHPEIADRFRREAEIASNLQHPHIVHIYEYGEFQGQPYLAMEYMRGGSLSDYLQNTDGVSLRTTLTVLSQIANALDYAHERGVVHRDLKLENILLKDETYFTLTDFGIARVIDATRLTMSGHVAGTPVYMSPEQARGNHNTDFRADLYSFAVMAYLMATGHFPFLADEPLVILNKQIAMEPPPPSQVNTNLPSEVDAVFAKALAKNPADRYASAKHFVWAFEEATRGTTSIITVINMFQPNPLDAPMEHSPLMSKEGATRLLGPEDQELNEPRMSTNGRIRTQSRRREKRQSRSIFWWLLPVGVIVALLTGFAMLQSGANSPTPEDPREIAFAILTQTAESWTETPIVTPSMTPTFGSIFVVVSATLNPASPTPSFGNGIVNDPNGADLVNADTTDYAIIRHLPYGEPLLVYRRSRDATFVLVMLSDLQTIGWLPVSEVSTSVNPPDLPPRIQDPPATPVPSDTPTLAPSQPSNTPSFTPSPWKPPTATKVPPTHTPTPIPGTPTSTPRGFVPPTRTNTPSGGVTGQSGPAPARTRTPTQTPTPLPTNTPIPPTHTAVPPTSTLVPPTDTPVPPTDTPVPPPPPTDTPVPPPPTDVPPPPTDVPPTDVPPPPPTDVPPPPPPPPPPTDVPPPPDTPVGG